MDKTLADGLASMAEDDAWTHDLGPLTPPPGSQQDRRLAAEQVSKAEQARAEARLRAAFDLAQRGAHACQQLGDDGLEARALCTVALAASALGRNEEAVEAGLLATQLLQALPPGPMHAQACHALGTAYLWSRSLDKAHTCLAQAVELARRCGHAADAVGPAFDAVLIGLLRVVDQRDAGVVDPSLDDVAERAHQLAAVHAGANPGASAAGLSGLAAPLVDLARALHLALRGDTRGARRLTARLQQALGPGKSPDWRGCHLAWAEAEIARREGDHERAQARLEALVDLAMAAEVEQLVCLGYRLMGQFARLRGVPGDALHHLQRMHQREWALRAECIASREAIVAWQLELRRTDAARRHLQATARRLERWSMEDHLTGLANRRAVEQALAERLAADPLHPRLALAFLDLDDFKAVNDRFGHSAGDEVLRRLAALLRHAVRGDDLVGRLAGDEFVVVLPNSDSATAHEIVERIEAMVRRHAWDVVAPGLRVSFSAGVAEARPADSVAALLHRGDTSMYRHKSSRRHAASR